MISLKHKQLFFLSSALIYVQPNTLGPGFRPRGVQTRSWLRSSLPREEQLNHQASFGNTGQREGGGRTSFSSSLGDDNLAQHRHCTNRATGEHSLRTHAAEGKKPFTQALPLFNRCGSLSKVKKRPSVLITWQEKDPSQARWVFVLARVLPLSPSWYRQSHSGDWHLQGTSALEEGKRLFSWNESHIPDWSCQ